MKQTIFHKIENLNDLWDLYWIFNDSALLFAAKEGHVEIVQELISREDIDINIKNILNNKKKVFIIFKCQLH